MSEAREHILSDDCWCQPMMDSYGTEYEFDELGEIIGVKSSDPEVDTTEDSIA